MESLLDRVLEADLLHDPEIRRALVANFEHFSAEALAKLITAGHGISHVAIEHVGMQRSAPFFAAVMTRLGDQEGRLNLLRFAGIRSPLFDAEHFASTVASLPELSERERRNLAVGLSSRLSLVKDQAQLMDMALQYLETAGDQPHVAEWVSRHIVDAMPVSEAAEWLRTAPESLVSLADMRFFSNLAPSDHEVGFELINGFVEDGQMNRARRSIEAYLSTYAQHQPARAFEWTTSLDDELITPQMLMTVLEHMVRRDSDEAQRMIDKMEDSPHKRSLQESLDRRATEG